MTHVSPNRIREHAADHHTPRLNGGCHTCRDTEAAIRAAGFQIEERERFSFRAHALAAPVAPRILGRALRP